MPWVNEELCTGCGICVEICPTNAIIMDVGRPAVINMDECIRCGNCHGVCPSDAVRHDSEKIRMKSDEHIATAVRLLGKCGSDEAKTTYLDKFIRTLQMVNSANEKTISQLEAMKKGLR